MKYFFLIGLISLILLGCNEENQPTNSTNKFHKKHKESQILSNPHKNSSNPYDTLGQRHNDIVDYFINNIDDLENACDSASKMTEIYNIFGEYANDTPDWNYTESETEQMMIDFNDDIKNNYDSYEEVIDSVFGTSGDAHNYAMDVEVIIKDFDDGLIDADSLYILLKDMEAELDTNSSLTSDDEKTLFCLASITRHSTFYWDDVFSDQGHAWNTAETNCTTLRNNKKLIHKDNKVQILGSLGNIILADATGYAATIAWDAINGNPINHKQAAANAGKASVTSAVGELLKGIWNGIESIYDSIFG